MKMGQVWSKADFDGTNPAGHHGGRGSVLAVTAQSLTIPAPLNQLPVLVSIDAPNTTDCGDGSDRVRSFYSLHTGGAHFLLGDGSDRFINENINQSLYRALSTINGKELIGEF